MASSTTSESEAPANIRVLVRIRPLNERELKINSHSVLGIDDAGGGGKKGGVIYIKDGIGTSSGVAAGYSSDSNGNNGNNKDPATSRSFTYDAVFGPNSQQVEIFDGIRGIIDAVCAGYNGTIVAYGQTGSGKTHTIFGEEGLYVANWLQT